METKVHGQAMTKGEVSALKEETKLCQEYLLVAFGCGHQRNKNKNER